MRFVAACLLFLVGWAPSFAWGPALPNENDAVALAAADAATLDDGAAITTRYVWVRKAEADEFKAVVLTLNYVSRASILYRPEAIGKDELMLVRVDLTRLAPVDVDGKNTDLNEIIRVWEEFQFDPVFNQLLTKDTLRFLAAATVPTVKKTVVESVLVTVPDFKGADGKTYNAKRVNKERVVEIPFKDQNEVLVLRNTAENIDPAAMAFLVNKLGTQAPVVTSEYFIWRALSTIKDDGLFKQLYGGLYYDLAGIKTGAKKGSDLDVLLEALGVGNVKGGVGFAQLFDKLRSDQRTAIFRSLVTGKPRRVIILPTLIGREERGLVIITQDFRDRDIDIGTHPIMNLLDLNAQAQEVIWVLPNGLHGFAAFDGKGKRTDEVPFDVANDSTIPRPHTQRLQAAKACIICHGPEGGWRILTNDAKKMVDANERFDILDDLQDRKRSKSNIFDRLAGLYAGDPERTLLPRSRADYATAILKATGPWAKSKDQTDVHQLAAERIATIYNDHVYGLVTPAKALRELGIHVDDKVDAAKLFAELVPPVPGELRDPRIRALQRGIGINRIEWDLVRSFVAVRIAKERKK